MSSTDFLSCDGNFLHLPDDRKFKNEKRKDFSSTRISCLTTQLATDSPPRPPKQKDPRLCCITTRTASIIGSCLTMIAILSISGYFTVRLLADSDKSHPVSFGKLLGLILPSCLILFCFMSFQWGLFSRKHFALLPFILTTLLLLVALIGTLVASMLMLPGEVDDINQKSASVAVDRSAGRMGEAIVIRCSVCAIVLLQIIFLYAYLRTFFYLRYLNQNN
ncbi:unnamed protein product, partial [Mesorhabditis belari]|uniref:Uncharacterized protein n=1 Tax=Mesorhabditis belari TaxID=2138241 RepID=A0AAF3FNB7_9BILA